MKSRGKSSLWLRLKSHPRVAEQMCDPSLGMEYVWQVTNVDDAPFCPSFKTVQPLAKVLHSCMLPHLFIILISLVSPSLFTPAACSLDSHSSFFTFLRTDDIGVVHVTLPGAIPAPLSAGVDHVLLHVFMHRRQQPAGSKHTADIAGYIFAELGVLH